MSESLSIQPLRHPQREWLHAKVNLDSRIKKLQEKLQTLEGPRRDENGDLTARGRLVEELMYLCAARAELKRFYANER